MELAWNFKDLVQFRAKTSVCTWMIDEIMKRNFEFQIYEFLDLLHEFGSKSFEFLL
jgi:hypothetical protein